MEKNEDKKKKILITGGCGYIGSHTVVEALSQGFSVVVLDSLCNSSHLSLDRINDITGKTIDFFYGDVRDPAVVREIFSRHNISAVLHFAGLKAVADSVKLPLAYYENNVYGTIVLLQEMQRAGVKKFIFSSSATVYGDSGTIPVSENCPTGNPSSPYGKSKLMVENILEDLADSDSSWAIGILRYFNPIGAHPSGLIGEDPKGYPSNLLPFITQVAVRRREKLLVFGNDYETPDGTGVRDYLHVVDLAKGHLCALRYLESNCGTNIWNLGSGKGFSVLEVIRAFEDASGIHIPYDIVGRRFGDIPSLWADPSKASIELGWAAEIDLLRMMRDSWNWQRANPNGFEEK